MGLLLCSASALARPLPLSPADESRAGLDVVAGAAPFLSWESCTLLADLAADEEEGEALLLLPALPPTFDAADPEELAPATASAARVR